MRSSPKGKKQLISTLLGKAIYLAKLSGITQPIGIGLQRTPLPVRQPRLS